MTVVDFVLGASGDRRRRPDLGAGAGLPLTCFLLEQNLSLSPPGPPSLPACLWAGQGKQTLLGARGGRKGRQVGVLQDPVMTGCQASWR